jgi:hypothetical protein
MDYVDRIYRSHRRIERGFRAFDELNYGCYCAFVVLGIVFIPLLLCICI